MNERQLECFLAVAELGSFSAASERLYITQPAVSHQIHALENELSVRLFERNTTRTRMTPAAYALLEDAQQLLTLYQRIRRSMETYSLRKNHLVFGCPAFMLEFNQNSFFAITQRLAEEKEPIPLDSKIAHKPPLHLQQLLSGEVDILISDLNQPELQLPELSHQFLFHSSVFVYMHRDHPLSQHNKISIQDIIGETIYLYSNQTSFLENIQKELRDHNIPYHCETKESFQQTIPFLTPSHGITFHPCSRPLNAAVIARPFHLPIRIPIGMVWLKKRNDPQLLRLVRIISSMPQDIWEATNS